MTIPPPQPAPEPVNPIYANEALIKAHYPAMNGITAWKDAGGLWQYLFGNIPAGQQAEVLAYARTLGTVP